jgi:lysophospholipase L1-like esterase
MTELPSTTCDPVKTLILGHSFVARANDYIIERGMGNLNLPTSYHDVQLYGKGGAKITDLDCMYRRGPGNSDLVIIDIGTNDLTGARSIDQLTSELIDSAEKILASGVKRVIILGVLSRTTRGRHRAGPGFNDRVKAFNKLLQCRMIRSGRAIHFWYHKGLSSRVEAFIQDGVHLSPDGLAKYVRSLRRVIMKYTSDLVKQ